MKSLNRHVPLLIFLLGMSCMTYSMLTFFHPSLNGSSQAEHKAVLPEGAGEIFTPTPRIPVVPPSSLTVDPNWKLQLTEQMHKITDAYLSKTGLEIKLPESIQYAVLPDGASETLIGVEPSGRIALYVFSGRGKFEVRNHVQDVLKDFGVKLAPKGAPYRARSGTELWVYKGDASMGYDYQAYLFKSKKTQNAVVLMDKGLSRHPAAIREVVESIRFR